MVVAAKLRRCNSSSMSCRSWFTENPPSLRTKLSRQPQMLVWEHAEASAAAAASFKSASRTFSGTSAQFRAVDRQSGQNPMSDHGVVAWRPQAMKQKPRSRANRKKAKTVLRLPDLEFAKAAVLNSLTNPDAQRGYRHAIDEFVDWYCSEPRLAFNRILVLRYRTYLETRQLAR